MKILFKNADILIPDGESLTVLKDAYLGVDGAYIAYIGTECPDTKDYDRILDYSRKLLMPGLVNTHGHAAMTLLRGVGSGLALQPWLFDVIFPLEDKLTPAMIATGNALAMAEMIASGTTSFSDMYMEPRTLVELNEQVGMKFSAGRVLQCFGEDFCEDSRKRIKEALAIFEEYNGIQEGRVRIDFLVHAEYTTKNGVTEEFARRCLPYADKGARMQIHISETKKEHEECIGRHGCTPIRWAKDRGLLELPTIAAHCVWVTDEDIEIMKEKGVTPVHNPSSNMKLGSGFAPLAKWLKAGLNVGLGTDGCSSNNNLNMFEEMHLASLLHNGFSHDPTCIKPEQLLRMVTVNGARAQGRTDSGSLETGKRADIIALDMDKPHLCPDHDTLALLCYSAQAADVCLTMVDGRILYENGEYKTLDIEKVKFEARQVAKELMR